MPANDNKKPRLNEGEVFLTNKEKVLSGSIRPLRGNEEVLGTSAFELSVAGRMPSFSLAFEAKTG